MYRGRIAAVLLGGALVISSLTMATAAGAATISVKISPTSGLTTGQMVKISGKGLPTTAKGKSIAWFADECTSAVAGKLTVADEKHCDVALAKGLKVAKNGTFATTFKVATGKVGDGTCSSTAPCVIGIGNVSGQGTVTKITFK